jgi:hypothetical protein
MTLADSPERRADAFEHDLMVDSLQAAFAVSGGTVEALAWDDDNVDWSHFDAALIGSTWDYQDRLDEFMDRLTTIGGNTRLFNSVDQVRWNCRKTYLRELQDKGAPTIATLWLDRPTPQEMTGCFDRLGSDDLIFKRQIGANAEGQYRLSRGDTIPAMRHPLMVQPFLPAIQQEGEISFIFVDGGFSHALLKTAADGEYRIQSSYGGSETAFVPGDDDLTRARAILALLEETPLYARVDMVRGDAGKLLLMELELIEPFLYPLQGPEFGTRIAGAIAKRIA